MDNGLITSWHREAELQRIYYRWPSDAFSLRLARFVALGGSHVDVYRRSGNAVAAFADKLLDHRRLLFAPHFVEDAGTFVTTDSRSITDVLHSWGGGGACAIGEIPALMLPQPLCELVARGKFSELLCCGRWVRTLLGESFPHPFGGWPTVQWLSTKPEDNLPPVFDNATEFGYQACRDIVTDLRTLAATPAQGLEGDRQLILEDILDTVNTWAVRFEIARGDYRIPIDGKLMHDSAKLLQCIRASHFLIGGAAALRRASRHQALAIASPLLAPCFADAADSAVVPSSSAMQRYELALDVAFMLLQQKSNSRAADVVRFGWADSSPQGGHNWLWIQSVSIRRDSLVQVWNAFLQLATAVQLEADKAKRQGAEEDDDILHDPLDAPVREAHPDWVPLLDTIRSGIEEHIHPPVDLTSGFEGLAHKAAGCAWSFALEVAGLRDLRRVCRSFQSFTSDLGVESGLSDFNAGVEQLLPSWRTLDDIVPDTGDDLLDQSLPDKHFLENAFPVAGFQHVTDNACADINKQLDVWDDFYKQLKNIEGLLLAKHRRDMLIWTCIRGTHNVEHEHLFHRWTATLYEKRWHEVTIFLNNLKPVFAALRQCWDQRKFTSGYDTQGQPRPSGEGNEQGDSAGGHAFDPTTLTRTLADPMFSACVVFIQEVNMVPQQLASWAEGCSCHEAMCAGLSEWRQRKVFQDHYGPGIGWGFCSGVRVRSIGGPPECTF